MFVAALLTAVGKGVSIPSREEDEDDDDDDDDDDEHDGDDGGLPVGRLGIICDG